MVYGYDVCERVQVLACHNTHMEVRGQPQESVLIFHLAREQASLVVLAAYTRLVHKVPMSLLCLFLPFPQRSTLSLQMCLLPHPAFIWALMIRSQGCYLCSASALPTEPFTGH